MNLLAIDTSGPVCGVAVLKDGHVAYEGMAVNRMTHSASLVPMIDGALRRSEMKLEEMNYLAAVTGPGSFTGIRIGVSTVKGLAHGTNKPCIGVDALEALAFGISLSDAVLCPIQDARAHQVYGAAFLPGTLPLRRLLPDAAIKLDDYIASVLEIAGDRPLCFTGDGVVPNREAIQAILEDRAILPGESFLQLRPSCVALTAAARCGEAVDYLGLLPVYLRPPQALTLQERQEGKKL